MKQYCPYCHSSMTHVSRNGVDWEWQCTGSRYCRRQGLAKIKREAAIERQALEDERRIARREADFTTYTQALIDLHAQRAREEVRR